LLNNSIAKIETLSFTLKHYLHLESPIQDSASPSAKPRHYSLSLDLGRAFQYSQFPSISGANELSLPTVIQTRSAAGFEVLLENG
jgi:hypothetical protein